MQLISLHQLHQKGIIHLDLKPGNILLDERNNLVISDFGMARIFEPVSDYIYPAWAQLRKVGGDDYPYLWSSAQNPHYASNVGGTAAYMAPEVANGSLFSYGVDYWSMGIILHRMITGFVGRSLLFSNHIANEQLLRHSFPITLPKLTV